MSEIQELKDEFISLHSDFSVVAPVYRTAMFLSQRTPVYFYTFEYEGELSFSEYLLQPPAELRDRRSETEGEVTERTYRSKRQNYKENDVLEDNQNTTAVNIPPSGEIDFGDDRRE